MKERERGERVLANPAIPHICFLPRANLVKDDAFCLRDGGRLSVLEWNLVHVVVNWLLDVLCERFQETMVPHETSGCSNLEALCLMTMTGTAVQWSP